MDEQKFTTYPILSGKSPVDDTGYSTQQLQLRKQYLVMKA